MRKKEIIFIISFLIISWLYPLMIKAADNAGAFLEKSLSPRATAMGMSHVCIAKNSDSVFWNPSILAVTHNAEIKLMGTNMFETQYLSVQTASYFLGLNWGLSYIGAKVDGINETERLQNATNRWVNTGNSLSYDANAYLISTAKKIIPQLSLGITAKLIQEKAAGYQAIGTGLDFGMFYTPINDFAFGLNVQNIIKPSMAWDTPSGNVDTIPLNIRVGTSAKMWDDRLLFSVDMNFRNNRANTVHMGIEYLLCEFFAIRAGLDNGNVSLGTGLMLANLGLDFSWSKFELDELDDIYRVSISYGF